MEQVDKQNLNTIAVCWTGGWDSTFRVLDLVVRHDCQVQPIYVIDPNRRSRNHEIAAMDKVRNGIRERFPEKADLLLDTLYFNAEKLEIPDSVQEQFSKIRSEYQIGWQYLWMAAAIRTAGYDTAEAMVHGNDHGLIWGFLRDKMREHVTPGGATTYILSDWTPTNEFEDGLRLFQNFAYPTIHLPKPDMEDVARESGFDHLLLLSWFCHFPLNDQPCGMCFTCRHVIYDGLRKRFPKSALRRNKVWFIGHPIRMLLMEPGRAVQRVKDLVIWTRASLTRARG